MLNKVKSTKVTIGSAYKQYTVINKGLKAGDVIVTNGLQKIQDGSEVDPKYANSNNKNSDGTVMESNQSGKNGD